MPFYTLVIVVLCLRALAVLVAVIRAPKEHLQEIVRAIMRMGPKDDDGDYGPPSLPKP
jgi:hypothetical protein